MSAKRENIGQVMRALGLGFGAVILLLMGVGIAYLLSCTMVRTWLFLTVLIMVAMASATLMWRWWRRITNTNNFVINFLLQTVVSAVILGFTVLAVNYLYADFDRYPEQEAVVVKITKETRYRTKRVTRRVYTRGAPYTVHVMTIELPDGTRRNIDVKRNIYERARRGDTALLRRGRGRLGMDILDESSLRVPHPSGKPVRHCRFVGTSGGKKEIPDWVNSQTHKKDEILSRHANSEKKKND